MGTATKSVVLYELIIQEIIRDLDDCKFADNQRISSESELAIKYNVSRITAQKALTELSLRGYIYRIQGKGSFVVPKSKRKSKETTLGITKIQKTKKIGVIIPSITDYHCGKILDGITKIFNFHDCFYSITKYSNSSNELFAINEYISQGYDGIILFPQDCEFYNKTIINLNQNNFPVVLIDRNFPGLDISYVVCNNAYGMDLAINYLIKLNHSKIAFAHDGQLNEQITEQRIDAFVNTMLNNGLHINKLTDCFFLSENKMINLLSKIREKKITAIIASNANTCMSIYNRCKIENIKIPMDLSIICFDNPEITIINRKFFTYIEQNSYTVGTKAAQILINIFKNQNSQNREYINVTQSLITGNSCKKNMIT